MEDILQRVKDFIKENNLICENDVVASTISGGADSVFMTYALNKLSKEMNFKIIGVHVNHLLRGEESFRDEEFSRRFCEEQNIKFKSYRVDVNKFSLENKLSIEMGAREVRYKIFYDLKNQKVINKCALAHHGDDDAETILMRIFKGTGTKGLEGIKEIREGFYIRPILFLRRVEEIEKFLKENDINFIIDHTNLCEDYLRNKVRLSIIPKINESFSMDVTKNVLTLKEICKIDNDFIDEIVEENIAKYVDISKECVRIYKRCFSIHKAILYRLIRECINMCKGDINDITLNHIKSICDLIEKRKGRYIQIKKDLYCVNNEDFLELSTTYEKYEVKHFNSVVLNINEINDLRNNIRSYISKEIDFLGEKIKISFEVCENLTKKDLINTSKDFKYFSVDDVCEISLRNRKDGDLFTPFGLSSPKKLKEFFINEKAENKDKIPLICFDNNIVWVVGFRNSREHMVLNNTKTIVKIKLDYL